MKNIKTVILASLLSTSLFALNIDDAVNISLENNLDILSQQYDYKESKENISLSRASLMPNLDLQYQFNDRKNLIPGQIEKESSASAIVSYNLFNGFKDIKTYSSAKYLSNSQRFTYEAVKQDILLNTKQVYINLLNKRKNLTTFEDAFKLFEKQYNDAQSKFDEGLLARNDLLKVEVNMLDAKQNVVNAKSEVNIARYELSNILGGYDLKNIIIDELSDHTLTSDFSEDNLENRSEIEALRMNVNSLKAQVSANKSGFYPKVDTTFSYNKYGETESVGGRTGYPDDQKIAGISASWNLFSGGKDSASIAISRAQLNKAMTQLDKTKLDIKLQYEKALSKLEVAKLNLKTATLSLKQAKENYEIVDNRFKEGLSTTTDLVDANYLLSSAKQRYFSSYYDKFLAVATLQRVLEIK